MEIGYIRVSSVGQNTVRQLAGIPLEKTFTDKQTGSSADRPQLSLCLEFCREGDTLHIHSIDRLARNLRDLLSLIKRLTDKKVRVVFHKENMTFDGEGSPLQNLHLHILGAVAEFERALIRERQLEGIAQAKKRGVYTKRTRKVSDGMKEEIIRRVMAGENKSALAREFHISRMTVYRMIRERKEC